MNILNKTLLVSLFTGVMSSFSAPVSAQEAFIGEVKFVGFNFAPRGWAKCDGQILPISNNQALFSILGTTYGGDGRTTFALPDMRGRSPVHPGSGPGLSSYRLGERTGQESITLVPRQIAPHTHSLSASSSSARTDDAAGNALARTRSNLKAYDNSAPNVSLNSGTVRSTGNSTPIDNMQPSNTLNCIIAIQGTFPSRS